MQQMDLMDDGELVVSKVKMHAQAADAGRKSGLTCWDRCDHCSPDLHGSTRSVVYRLCKQVGCKCYHLSEVCEWVEPPLPPPPPRPHKSGWEDY